MAIVRLLAIASTIVAGALLVAIVAVTTVAIFYRYFLGTPIIVTEELSRVLLILLAYCGSVAVPQLKEHVAVEILYDLLPPVMQRLLDKIHYIVGAAFLGLLAISGYQLASSMGGIRLPALQIPVSFVFGTVAVACGLHAIVYVIAAVESLFRQATVVDDEPVSL